MIIFEFDKADIAYAERIGEQAEMSIMIDAPRSFSSDLNAILQLGVTLAPYAISAVSLIIIELIKNKKKIKIKVTDDSIEVEGESSISIRLSFFRNYASLYFEDNKDIFDRMLDASVFLPLSAVQHRNPMNFKGSVNSYTEAGRKEIHHTLDKIDLSVLRSLMETPEPGSTIYNDNRLAVYCAQHGNCAISGKPLAADEVRFLCLHGNTDYKSIVMVHWLYLPLLTMERPLQLTFPLSKQEKIKVNKLRSKQGLNAL